MSRKGYVQLTSSMHEEARYLSPCNLKKKENIAIVLAYFAIGIVSSFISTPLNVYMVEVLNAEPQMQSTIGILQSLPWSLKLIFGFLSDSCPINGMHRKPYLTFGALIYSAAFIFYAVTPINNVVVLAICIFCGTIGLIQVDVMADTMCVERSKFEPDETKGQMQASCYSIRFLGSLLGAVMGTTLSNSDIWGWGLTFKQVSFLNGFIPFLLITPFLFSLKEKYHKGLIYEEEYQAALTISKETGEIFSSGDIEIKQYDASKVDNIEDEEEGNLQISFEDEPSLKKQSSDNKEENEDDDEPQSIWLQIDEIWQTVQLKAVWRPMAFVYTYNLLQIPNVAWQSYLQLGLHFQPWVLGLTVTLGSFMTFAGVLAYKYIFFKASWRNIYVWSTSFTSFFSLMQLVLIFQLNKKFLHINNYFFSLGDDVITAYISGIQFLPVCIMYMRLCPEGSEGASYAMLTTFGNIALVCAANLGNLMASIWDVSNDAMRANDVSGLWRLTVLTSVLEILPLGLLWLLPRDAKEQDELAKSQERSKLGGMIFMTVLCTSLIYSIASALYRLGIVWGL